MHGAEHVTCRQECHKILHSIAKKAFGHSNSKKVEKELTTNVMDTEKQTDIQQYIKYIIESLKLSNLSPSKNWWLSERVGKSGKVKGKVKV